MSQFYDRKKKEAILGYENGNSKKFYEHQQATLNPRENLPIISQPF